MDKSSLLRDDLHTRLLTHMHVRSVIYCINRYVAALYISMVTQSACFAFRLTIEQVLDMIEDDSDEELENEPALHVAIGMPDEDDDTDCDSDNEDTPTGDPSHFGKGILTAPCDLRRTIVLELRDRHRHRKFCSDTFDIFII